MQKAALYIRVSTDDQTEYSPAAQQKALEDYALRNKLEIVQRFVDEGFSARTAKRPEFQRMIAAAKDKPRPFDVILVHKFDRFARNREDSVVFKSLLRRDCGIRVVSITEPLDDDKMSILIEALLEAMAEYYSINLSEEVKKGQTPKAEEGGFMARPPLGYTVTEKQKPPVVVEEEVKIIRLIFDKYTQEQMSAYAITRHLNDLGLRMPKGNRFNSTRVNYVLANEFYCGKVTWNKRDSKDGGKLRPESEWITAQGEHEAIISEEQYLLAQQITESRKCKGPKRPYETYKHWLSGLVRCGHCTGAMDYHSGRNQFRCGKYAKQACDHANSIYAPHLESHLLERIKTDTLPGAPLNVTVQRELDRDLEIELLERKLQRHEDKLLRIREAFEAGIDTLEEYKANKQRLLDEENSLRLQIEELHNQTAESSKYVDMLRPELLTAHGLLSSEASKEQKHLVAQSLLEKLVFTRRSKTEADLTVYYTYRVPVTT